MGGQRVCVSQDIKTHLQAKTFVQPIGRWKKALRKFALAANVDKIECPLLVVHGEDCLTANRRAAMMTTPKYFPIHRTEAEMEILKHWVVLCYCK